MKPLVSIVVPVLNEATALPRLLDRLAELEGRWEIVISDGGSTDATCDIAARHPLDAAVVHAPGGRAAQMNAGAAVASGDALVFLHADTQLPDDAHAELVRALADPAVQGGNFALRFDGGDRFSRLLGAWYALQRRARVYYGDPAIWLRRAAFERLGGYRELPIMEDYDLVRRTPLSAPPLNPAGVRRVQRHTRRQSSSRRVQLRFTEPQEHHVRPA